MKVSGSDVLAYFQNCTATFSRELLDVSAAQDTWTHRESCRSDVEFTVGKVMLSTEDLLTLFMAGGTVYVSCDIAGKTLYFVGIMENANVTSGNPIAEGATIRLGNGTPTLT